MKKVLKQIPKTLLICLIVFFTSCSKEEFYETENLSKTKVTARYINFNELKKNQKAFEEFQEVEQKVSLSKSSNQTGLNSRLIYLSQYNFTIDTDKILLVEKGDYKSYTFPIYHDEFTEKVENLVINLKNNDVISYLSKYTLTELEKQKIENNEYVDLYGKIEISKLKNQAKSEPCFEFVKIPAAWNAQGQVTLSLVSIQEIDCPDEGGGSSGGGGGGSSDGSGSSGGGGSGSGGNGYGGGGWYGGGTWGGGWNGGGGSGSGGTGYGSGGSYGGNGGGSSGGNSSGGNGQGDPNSGDYQNPNSSDWSESTIVTYPVINAEDGRAFNSFLNHIRTTDVVAYNYLNSHPEIKNQLFFYLIANDFSEESTIFVKELIEDMINFPISEGNDGDAPDFNYDDYSNVQTQTQSLPNRNGFYNVFPKIGTSGMPASQVYQLIGGTILNSHINERKKYENACALRVSRALNYSGNRIPVFYNNLGEQRTQKGADNLNYILDAASLLAYMKKTFPDSNPIHLVNKTPIAFKSAMNGKWGIYIMLPKNTKTFGASGHADFWSNTGCLSGCHFEDAKEIYFWELF